MSKENPNELKIINKNEILKYQKLLYKYKQQISDLEAKLAEHNEYFRSFSCENFNEFQDFISTFMLTPHEEQTLIKDLKKQLKEKDEEIKKLNSCVDFYKSYYISFNEKVIDELEKVKDYFIEGYAVCKNFSDFYWNFTEQIDNQIEALTHQQEDKGE